MSKWWRGTTAQADRHVPCERGDEQQRKATLVQEADEAAMQAHGAALQYVLNRE